MWAGYRSAPNKCAFMTPASKQTARSELRWRLGMHTLVGLLVAAAVAYAVARPPNFVDPSAPPVMSQLAYRTPAPPPRPYLEEYLMRRLLAPRYFGNEDSFPAESYTDDHEWLNKEIYRLSQMEDEDEPSNQLDVKFSRWMTQDPYMAQQDLPAYIPSSRNGQEVRPITQQKEVISLKPAPNKQKKVDLINSTNSLDKKQTFAMTPLDTGYYEPEEKVNVQQSYGLHEGGESKWPIEITPARQIRQNPNLVKTNNLIADSLDRFRAGLTHESVETTDRPRHIHVLESASDPAESIYGIALIAAVGAALALATFGFAFGWYKLSKKAKAAADVDYPAYGVTGPTIDTSGDRKLAHSAHMYHYQHQKQQIIAMERNGLEQRNGSVSDPESEEENEEGDYTVYECPGFATTGDMEVKNPLFSDEPTPATPGKCEIVKPQPKD